MSSGCLERPPKGTRTRRRPAMARLLWMQAMVTVAIAVPCPASAFTLRVCADPNNLPFSNQAGEGLENKIVAIVASELHAQVVYTWWAERRGFIRETLNAGKCDLVPGTLSGMDMLRTTRPYYRSAYVFVTRAADRLTIGSLDDPVLRNKKIGVQLIGDDGANSPPAHALAQRGLVDNLRGYPIYGDYANPSPGRAIISALDRGDIDIAVVWGPTAGYFALQDPQKLDITPVASSPDQFLLPMVFDIAMGVRKDDEALRDEIETALSRRRADIATVLKEYNVPLVVSGTKEPKKP